MKFLWTYLAFILVCKVYESSDMRRLHPSIRDSFDTAHAFDVRSRGSDFPFIRDLCSLIVNSETHLACNSRPYSADLIYPRVMGKHYHCLAPPYNVIRPRVDHWLTVRTQSRFVNAFIAVPENIKCRLSAAAGTPSTVFRLPSIACFLRRP